MSWCWCIAESHQPVTTERTLKRNISEWCCSFVKVWLDTWSVSKGLCKCQYGSRILDSLLDSSSFSDRQSLTAFRGEALVCTESDRGVWERGSSSLHHPPHTWLVIAWSGPTCRILGFAKGEYGVRGCKMLIDRPISTSVEASRHFHIKQLPLRFGKELCQFATGVCERSWLFLDKLVSKRN